MLRFGDPTRWLIAKRRGQWHVLPPVASFWGRHTKHATGAEALADFNRQITRG